MKKNVKMLLYAFYWVFEPVAYIAFGIWLIWHIITGFPTTVWFQRLQQFLVVVFWVASFEASLALILNFDVFSKDNKTIVTLSKILFFLCLVITGLVAFIF